MRPFFPAGEIGPLKQIKGRNFEIPGCGGFLLTDYVPGLERYFQIGEEIVCYVVPKPGETLTEPDILAHCEGSLPPFKSPKQVYIVDALPKSDRGKILRDDLKKIWAADNPTR